jgi:hypothetical protein
VEVWGLSVEVMWFSVEVCGLVVVHSSVVVQGLSVEV